MLILDKINLQQWRRAKEIYHKATVSSLYLKLLIPHEVESLLDLRNCAGAFPAEVCGCTPV